MKKFLQSITLKKTIMYLQVLSMWLLVAAIPFRMGAGTRIIMGIAGLLFFVEYFTNKRWKEWKWNRNKWFYIAIVAYYLFIPIWQLFSDTLSPAYHIALERRLAFLICGIIGLLGLSKQVKLHHICTIFLLTAVGTALYIIWKAGGTTFFAYDWGRQSFLFMQTRIALVNSHMVYNMYLNFSLIAAFYLISLFRRKPWQLTLTILAAIWVFYVLCLTEGRVGLLTSFLLVFSFIIISVAKYSWKLVPILLLVFAGIAGWVMMNNQRMKVDFITQDPREMIWKAGWKNTQVSPIVGQGVSDAKESFVEIVHQDKKLYNWWMPFVKEKKHGDWHQIHTHNAFLQAWAEFGLIGLLTLLFIFIYPLTMLPKKHQIYLFMIVGCVGIQCLFDIFLSPILYCLAIMFFTETTSKSLLNKEKDDSPAIE